MTLTDLKRNRLLLIAGLVLIALNLRPALAGVGPLIEAIRESTGLSNTALGMLTTLPLLAFGVVSSFTSLFTRKLGLEGTLALALALVTGGILIRVVPGAFPLFTGTLVLGIGIALGNVLLPSLVKRDFPHKSGIMTGLYSSMLGMGAALAAGLSVPLAQDLQLGWRWSLGSWALLSFLALLIWMPQLYKQRTVTFSRSYGMAMNELGRSKLAWQVAIFMGLQSFAFYIILAWLPDLLQDRGLGAEEAGWMLSLSQGTGVLGTLLIPPLAERLSDQRLLVWLLVLAELICLAALMVPDTYLVGLWVSVIGFSLGGSFGLALLFIVIKTSTSETATELSGMAQSIGYLLAAAGPALFGGLYDLTQAWFLPLLLLILSGVIKLWTGVAAGRPRAAAES